ncbi:SAV_2336 N-terminal domain-related protein [Streptomyces sp. NPDC029044]|uniref:SAV_2336 N-terminal domain-related protein n=1 Tax=Streptomyces sp. NPDC029044 TaxID=3157198 RepID=UPI0033FD42A8
MNSPVAEALDALVRALAGALGEDADADAIADALWLAAAPAAASAGASDGPPGPAPADATGQEPEPPSVADTEAPASPHPVAPEDSGTAVLYERLPDAQPAAGVSVSVPGGRDLPRALELRRALRPFKRRYARGRRLDLDLDATVRDYRRTGELSPVLGPAPEPWFELLLVVDASPTMAVWQNTIAEFTTLLAGLGAFRRVRAWSLRPGPDPVVTDHQGRPVAPGQAVSADGRRLVVVVSDCVAPGWRRPQTWRLLRGWGTKGPVALLNPLPSRLWHRTGLDLPAIRVGQRRPALRNTDLTFHVPLLLRTLPGAGDADWQALPTLTFSPHSLARWAETFMRGSPRGYDAVLVPSTGIVPSPFPTPNAERRPGPDPTEVFLRTASPFAVRLAALSSPFGVLSLPLMHLIRQQLLPEASVGDLAEVLTSPFVTVQPYEDGPPVIVFDDATRERLTSLLSRRDAWRTYDALSRHIAARAPGGAQDVQATATFEPERMPPALYPFARASNELLALLRAGAQRVPAPARERPALPAPVPTDLMSTAPVPTASVPTDPMPGRRLPDPAHSTALLIGVSRSGKGSLPGVEADLAGMRSFLTSPEGWNLLPDRCVSLVNPRGAAEVLDAVTQACDTTDTVLLYFAGHGRVDKRGRAAWQLATDEEPDSRVSALFTFRRIAHILDHPRFRHLMLILDHDGGPEAFQELESWDPQTGQGPLGMQVLFADRARDITSERSLTGELLRVATVGVPNGPEFLDLHTISTYLSNSGTLPRPHARVRFDGPSAPAFARNRAGELPASSTGPNEDEGVGATEPVDPLYESVRQSLRSALPRTYQGVYRREADRLLRALLAFAESFIDGAEQADSEATLADAVQDYLADREIFTDREIHPDVDVGWSSEAGLFEIRVARYGAGRSWNAEPSVSFELVLDHEGRAWMTDLVECVTADTSEAFPGDEKSCLVVMRLPVPRHRVHDAEAAAVDQDEPEIDDPSLGTRWFSRDDVSDAVDSACERLLGEAFADASDADAMDGAWALHGVALPPGLTDVTIQDITPDTQSIIWDTVEEYEEGLVLGQVTVDVRLVLEGLMHKSDYALTMREVRLLYEVNDHMVEVSVERSAQLVFDARRESEDLELEFRGTNAVEPNPHDFG